MSERCCIGQIRPHVTLWINPRIAEPSDKIPADNESQAYTANATRKHS